MMFMAGHGRCAKRPPPRASATLRRDTESHAMFMASAAPSQLSGVGSDLGRSSDASLRYKEAELHSRVFVNEQHGDVIGCVTFFYDVGWNGFPLAIFQVLPLV
jgi:hypothetical protein